VRAGRIPISSIALGHDGRILATGSLDATVRLWSTSPPYRQRLEPQVLSSDAAVDDLALSPNGHTFAIAGSGGTVLLVHVSTSGSGALPGTPAR
jgi:WD40 repeat protein